MNVISRACTVLCLLAVAACSSSDSGEDSGEPVASSPLSGTVDGKPFAAKSAIARSSGGGDKRSISIYDVDATCDDASPQTDREILFSVPWKAGTSRPLKLDFTDLNGSQTVTFVVGKSNNIISNSGRIEVLEAPTEKGTTGKIRVRASADGHSVEGEIAVQVCGS